jgi:hypothetical protein
VRAILTGRPAIAMTLAMLPQGRSGGRPVFDGPVPANAVVHGDSVSLALLRSAPLTQRAKGTATYNTRTVENRPQQLLRI